MNYQPRYFQDLLEPESIRARSPLMFPVYKAVELVQIVLRDDASHAEAHRLRLRFMEELVRDDRCVMSRGAWHHFATEDRTALGETAE